MSIGSITKITFTGDGSQEIYDMAKDAMEAEFFDRVFHNDLDWVNATDEDYKKWERTYGVNSLCSAWINSSRENDETNLELYSCYDTPIGVWQKIAEDFPEIVGKGFYYRELAPCDKAAISIKKGKLKLEKID